MQTNPPSKPKDDDLNAMLLAQPEWWRVTLSSIGDAVIATDASGRVSFMNTVAETLTGHTQQSSLGRPLTEIFDIINEHTGARVTNPVERVFYEGRVIGLANHTLLCRPDGTCVPVDDSGAPIYADNGSLLGAVLVFRDITDRRRVERELNRRAQALATLNECAVSLSSELDADRLIQRVTDAATQLSGAKFGAFFYNVINDSGEAYTLYTLSGAPREAFSKFPMPRNTDVFGPTFRGQGVVRSDDITKDPRYGRNAPYHGMPPGHLPVRSYLAVPVISRSGEVIGGLFFGHPERGVFTQSIEQVLVSLASHAAIAIDNARLFQAANRELEARKQTEAALRHQSEVTKTITENATAALFMIDEHGYCTFMNPAAARMTGYSFDEIRAMPLHEMIHHHHPDGRPFPMAECPIDRALHDYFEIRGVEDVFIRKDGTFFPVLCSVSPIVEQGKPVAAVLEVTDITEAKRANQELVRHRQHLEMLVQARTAELDHTHERLRISERLAAIGTLAAGIGHDMGNLLLPLRSRLEALRKSIPASTDDEHLSAIEQSANYLQALARGLRLLALDPDDPHASGLQTLVPEWWTSVQSLMRSVLSRPVKFDVRFEDGLPPLQIAPHRLTQAMLNLLTNANQALLHRPNAHVTISAMRAPGHAASVHLTIADNGPGMAPDVKRRALEPFFTTRHRSISTGLGLSMVHGIVTSVGGKIDITSEPGQGTSITLAIPSANGVPKKNEKVLRSAVVSVADQRRRMFIARMLELTDYAISFADHPHDSASLWVTDSGPALARFAHEFLTKSQDHHVLALDSPPRDLGEHPRMTAIRNRRSTSEVRSAIHNIAVHQRPNQNETPGRYG